MLSSPRLIAEEIIRLPKGSKTPYSGVLMPDADFSFYEQKRYEADELFKAYNGTDMKPKSIWERAQPAILWMLVGGFSVWLYEQH